MSKGRTEIRDSRVGFRVKKKYKRLAQVNVTRMSQRAEPLTLNLAKMASKAHCLCNCKRNTDGRYMRPLVAKFVILSKADKNLRQY